MAVSETNLHAFAANLGIKGGYDFDTMTGDETLDDSTGCFVKRDPGGSARNLTMPTETGRAGAFYWLVNAADAAENITVKDSGGSTVVTLNQNDSAVLYCDGSTYQLFTVVPINQS